MFKVSYNLYRKQKKKFPPFFKSTITWNNHFILICPCKFPPPFPPRFSSYNHAILFIHSIFTSDRSNLPPPYLILNHSKYPQSLLIWSLSPPGKSYNSRAQVPVSPFPEKQATFFKYSTCDQIKGVPCSLGRCLCGLNLLHWGLWMG